MYYAPIVSAYPLCARRSCRNVTPRYQGAWPFSSLASYIKRALRKKYIEDITRWGEDMNFFVRVARTISYSFAALTREILFFLLYRHTDDSVFDDFPKISDHFPKISEDSAKLVRWSHERCRTFSENFRRFPKIAEDFRGRPKDVSIINRRI